MILVAWRNSSVDSASGACPDSVGDHSVDGKLDWCSLHQWWITALQMSLNFLCIGAIRVRCAKRWSATLRSASFGITWNCSICDNHRHSLPVVPVSNFGFCICRFAWILHGFLWSARTWCENQRWRCCQTHKFSAGLDHFLLHSSMLYCALWEEKIDAVWCRILHSTTDKYPATDLQLRKIWPRPSAQNRNSNPDLLLC